MQNFNVKCKEHPQRTISYIYVKSKCPYPSRLACVKCITQLGENQLGGYFDILDFLNDPTKILSSEYQQSSQYNQFSKYFEKTAKKPYEVIQQFKKKINELIDRLLSDLEEGMEQYSKFQESVKKAENQLVESLNHKNLIQQFETIQSTQNYHEEKVWKEFENYISSYLEQFSLQENQELQETLHILQENEKDFFDSTIITNFSKNVDLTLGTLIQDLFHMGRKKYFFQNSYCSDKFTKQLLTQIDKNQRLLPTLIFKGNQQGLNADSFWKYFVKWTVFGGYTPLKWLADINTYTDPTNTSFLFNQNLQEIYPIQKNKTSISTSYILGPCFGGEKYNDCDLFIGADFQEGYSTLGSYYQADISLSKKTRLMGGDKPNLVDMEVYLIQKI